MKTIISAGRIMILVLASLLAFTSCSKDDGDDNSNPYEKKIVGTWYNGDLMYRFDADGTGDYYAGDVWGDIRYNMQGTTVFMRITYVNSTYGNVWKGEHSGTYIPEKDTFHCDGKVFTREANTTPSNPVDSVVSDHQ